MAKHIRKVDQTYNEFYSLHQYNLFIFLCFLGGGYVLGCAAQFLQHAFFWQTSTFFPSQLVALAQRDEAMALNLHDLTA